jgi:hypothetical protein
MTAKLISSHRGSIRYNHRDETTFVDALGGVEENVSRMFAADRTQTFEFDAVITVERTSCLVHGDDVECFRIENPSGDGATLEQHPETVIRLGL